MLNLKELTLGMHAQQELWYLVCVCVSQLTTIIGPTVPDFFAPSRIPDIFIIVSEVEEHHTIKPLVAQALVSFAVYGGMFSRFPCSLSASFCGQFMQ